MTDKTNEFILDPIPHEWGYVSEDDNWMAVPFGDEYMVIKNDQQVKSFKRLNAAKKYIQNQIQEPEDPPQKPVQKRQATKKKTPQKQKKPKQQKLKKVASLEDFM